MKTQTVNESNVQIDNDKKFTTMVESLGVYLPETETSTSSIIKNCKNRLLIPFEKMTGIKSRRMAGETEFSIDLAKGAISDCLQHSKYLPKDIDLIVAANISKQDSKTAVNLEPTSATVLRESFGFNNAMAFDLGNACAGVFTAIKVVHELIRAGDVRRALIVSGEYITHLTKTAQREMKGARDPRLACLTLGDAGVCLLLEEGTEGLGFDLIDLYTVPEYAKLCIAHSAETHGAIMYTDSVALAEAAVKEALPHFGRLINGDLLSTNDIDIFIPHQTSSTAIKQSTRALNKHFGRTVLKKGAMVDNLKYRGNTATTSHWVALKDLIVKDAVKSGMNIGFSIMASGITIGCAHYKIDNLAQRLNGKEKPELHIQPATNKPTHIMVKAEERLRICSSATVFPDSQNDNGNVVLAAEASKQALACLNTDDRGLRSLLYAGIYRKEFISEPALATLVANEMGLLGAYDGKVAPLFAFDLIDGAPGYLLACQINSRLLKSENDIAIVTASEYIENPANEDSNLNIKNMGSAVVLERSKSEEGFSSFFIDSHPEKLSIFKSFVNTDEQGPCRLEVSKNAEWQAAYVESILISVKRMLDQENLSLDDFSVVVPPQISTEFISDLSEALNIDMKRLIISERLADLDFFSSSIAVAWSEIEKMNIESGNRALIISVGSGIEVICAIYNF